MLCSESSFFFFFFFFLFSDIHPPPPPPRVPAPPPTKKNNFHVLSLYAVSNSFIPRPANIFLSLIKIRATYRLELRNVFCSGLWHTLPGKPEINTNHIFKEQKTFLSDNLGCVQKCKTLTNVLAWIPAPVWCSLYLHLGTGIQGKTFLNALHL